MDQTVEECPLAAALAQRLRDAEDELTSHWLERISERVALDAMRVFPGNDLIDHMPLLIRGIAETIEHPETAVARDSVVMAKAMELGALRYAQGFDPHEILKEYEIFGGILFAFFTRTVDEIPQPCTRTELAACYQRLFRAVIVVQEATWAQFHELMRSKIAEREGRLRLFNRALTHELRNHIGAARGATEMLSMTDLDPAARPRLTALVARNLDEMQTSLDNLLELTRLAEDVRQHRHVRLREATMEAMRNLREAAQAARVDARIAPDIPDVEVSAAAVELCLTNLVSNAIKYADPAKSQRWIEVAGRVVRRDDTIPHEVVIEVRDNGIGVAPEDRPRLFDRFFRGDHEMTRTVAGTGLGLSIVHDMVQGLGGRVWAEFPPEGSVFAFSLPCRRGVDTATLARE